ncbi:hypothetical protein [Sphingobacterium arenae]|uniref:Phosphatidate cytidylyltransferase n=1 Tax=Sphingobacterium arenae TaxID=1280598 RepID=A0ABR7Y900_9SPHI|nr:hypothetical protein [Sphingobacterium arenae]MBD1427788.1 hypothetical protein [Sphingobacterium arenae]
MKRISQVLFLSLTLVLFNSCAVIEGIFKAGVWVGILFVVAIIAVVIWIISKFFKNTH